MNRNDTKRLPRKRRAAAIKATPPDYFAMDKPGCGCATGCRVMEQVSPDFRRATDPEIVTDRNGNLLALRYRESLEEGRWEPWYAIEDSMNVTSPKGGR